MVTTATLDALIDAVQAAHDFAQHVLDCDRYGCENGPSRCLHGEASRQLDKLDRFDFGKDDA